MAAEGGIEARNVAGAITSMRIDELVSNLAIGIAKGQLQLDQVCMDIARFMSDAQVAFGKRAGSDEPDLMSLIELGFTPNFYQFVDTILEVRVAVSTKYEQTQEIDSSDTQLHTSQVDQQSQYAAQQSSSNSGSGYGYSGGYSVGWGWGGYGVGWGGSGYNYNYGSSASSSQSGSSAYQAKNLQCTTVDAKYASTYNFSVEASSIIKTKIVPVPPPAVFEEIVRSKLKERRDAEDRDRLRRQVGDLLPQLSASAKKIGTNGTYFPTSTAVMYKPATAQALQKEIADLQTAYNGITIPQWATIGSVPDRAELDGFMATVNDGMAKALTCFNADGDVEEPEGVSLPDTLKAMADAMKAFAAKLDAVKERMFPPAA